VTAAGEWLPAHLRADRYAQCDESCTVDCGACKGDGPPSRVAGSIGRSLADAGDGGLWAAYERYRARLDELAGDPD
jgi:hypothetical protein